VYPSILLSLYFPLLMHIPDRRHLQPPQRHLRHFRTCIHQNRKLQNDGDQIQSVLTKFADAQEKDEERLEELRAQREEEIQRADMLTNTLVDVAKMLTEDVKQRSKDREEYQQRMQALEAQQAATANILSDIAQILKSVKQGYSDIVK